MSERKWIRIRPSLGGSDVPLLFGLAAFLSLVLWIWTELSR
ncbi:MAG TPA: hypothetical protein VFR23_04245 [Jiangellaceae bacterium]|nr:hypothetical protein [Jiangellaceae bacterium]